MPKVREGKTKRDKRTGSHRNRFANRADRVAWQHGTGADSPTQNNFPYKSCNGKRNRTRWTGKGNSIQTCTYQLSRR